MFNDPQKLVSLILAGAAFGLVLSVWLVALLIWSMARKRRTDSVDRRLQLVQPQNSGAVPGRVLRLWHQGRETTTVVPGLPGKGGPLTRLRKLCNDAGVRTPFLNLVLGLTTAIVALGAGIYLVIGSPIAAAGGPTALLIAMYIYLTHSRARRRAIFDRQLIDALDLAARSLRVGHPLVASFRLIGEEVPAPIGDLFGEVCQQQELGVAMDQSLRQIAARHDSEDLRFFATSVVIQLRSGGNLADMMERLAAVMRERCRLARRVKVLTAQTQLSKRILLALPFFVFILLSVLNPSYMRVLYTTFPGQCIVVASSICLLLGWVMMNWLSKLTP